MDPKSMKKFLTLYINAVIQFI